MTKDASLPTKEQFEDILDRLLPSNEEMDVESASIILEERELTVRNSPGLYE